MLLLNSFLCPYESESTQICNKGTFSYTTYVSWKRQHERKDNISENTTVKLKFTYKSLIHLNVERHVEGLIDINVLPLPLLDASLITMSMPNPAVRNRETILTLVINHNTSESQENWKKKSIIWRNATIDVIHDTIAVFASKNKDGKYKVKISVIFESIRNPHITKTLNTAYTIVIDEDGDSELELLQNGINNGEFLVNEFLTNLGDKIDQDILAETDIDKKTKLQNFRNNILDNINEIYTNKYYKEFLDNCLKDKILSIDSSAIFQ